MARRRAHSRKGYYNKYGTWVSPTWVRECDASPGGGGGSSGAVEEFIEKLIVCFFKGCWDVLCNSIKFVYRHTSFIGVLLLLLGIYYLFSNVSWVYLAPFVYAFLVAAPLAYARLGSVITGIVLFFLMCDMCSSLSVIMLIAIVFISWVAGTVVALSEKTESLFGACIGSCLLLNIMGYPLLNATFISLIIGVWCVYASGHGFVFDMGRIVGLEPSTLNDVSAESHVGPEYDVDCCDKFGRTPLHRVNNSALAEKLIQQGADVNARDIYGKTPLHYARNPDIARVLLSHDADINACDIHGKTPQGNINVITACNDQETCADQD